MDFFKLIEMNKDMTLLNSAPVMDNNTLMALRSIYTNVKSYVRYQG